MKQSLVIRDLVEADVAAFFALLQDKAVFDGCPDALLSTEASVRTALFGPRPMTRALVAVVDEFIIVIRGGVPTFVRVVAERHARGDFSSEI